MASLEERRQWPRLRLNLKVVHTHPKTLRAAIDFSRDLSRGGFFLWTKRQRKVGDSFQVELSATQALMPRGVIRGTCTVTRITSEGLAARFISVDPDSEAVLEAFLATAAGARR